MSPICTWICIGANSKNRYSVLRLAMYMQRQPSIDNYMSNIYYMSTNKAINIFLDMVGNNANHM